MTPELLREYQSHCVVIDSYQWSKPEKKLMKREIRKTLERCGWVDPKSFPAEHRWNLCSERLRRGDFSNWDGWEFRSDWAMTYWWGQDIKIPIPKLDLTKAYSEPVKHIVVLGEQGLGDEICYSSVLPELIARAGHKAIEFQCYPRLKEIFERSFKVRCTDRLPLSEVKVGEAVITLGDLLPLYRKSREHFPRKPFLRVDPQKVARWLEWLNPFPRPWVGYAYKSRHGSFTHDEFWTTLGVGAKFDLQYDSDTRHRPPFDTKNDFENLFAFVSCLDSVQSVTQTLCHVAGAIGKECHAVIPPKNGETISKLWYYAEGKDVWESPVYPNMKIYRNIDEFRNRRA
jgi:hypothetical protein